ncbi:ABC transporter substrate-binding protein [Prochlorococcus marinus]|uniref:ABC transporter substrate-binding protein n=1 Tax=Prochlorococcus marinus TaxID=1219 RepID=UPI00019009B0|nr:ABC transporter substrate-binding protein [Prochlorococcus marinus]EEE40784.1 ABC transporter iron binding protein [Prochlorococcus marinus str. MIT 9202]
MIYKFFKISFLFILCSQFTQIVNSSENAYLNKRKKIVALTSLSADLVNSIDSKSLVGIPGSSLLKSNPSYKDIEIISSGRMPPNLEKIIRLKPDLVIGANGFHDKPLSKLNELGIKTLSTKIKNLKDLENLNREINSFLLKKDIEPLSKKIKNCYFSSSKISKNKNVIALVSTKPILSPNSKSWSGNLIKRFGLKNLTSDLQSKSEFKGYVNLSQEWLLKSKPNNLIVVKTPGSNISQYESLAIWTKIPAVKKKNIFSFNYYGLINPGSLDSINKACIKLSSI